MNNWIRRFKESTFLERLLTFTIILGVITFIIAFFFFLSGEELSGKKLTGNGLIKSDKFGQFGDFVGSITGTLFSIATTILIYLTYKMQKEELKETKNAISLQRYDNIFFSLLEKYQNLDFTDNDVYKKPHIFAFKFNDGITTSKKESFKKIKSQFEYFFADELQRYFNQLLNIIFILDSFELEQSEKNKYVNTYLKPHFDKYEVILLFYFGLSEYGKKYKHLIEKYAIIEHIDIEILDKYKEFWKDYNGESYNFGEKLNKKLPRHPYKLPPQ
jgi:hypothetical protein